METRLQGLFSGCEGRRKGRAAYMFQYSRQFFPLVFLRVPRGRRRSDQVWFALSLASIIDRECLSVWRKDWTKNESCSFFFFAACLNQDGTLYSDNKHSSNISDQNSAVFFLTAHSHWWRALIHDICSLKPQLLEAPAYGISQVSVTGKRAWGTTCGFFSASAKERHISLLLSIIGQSKSFSQN